MKRPRLWVLHLMLWSDLRFVDIMFGSCLLQTLVEQQDSITTCRYVESNLCGKSIKERSGETFKRTVKALHE